MILWALLIQPILTQPILYSTYPLHNLSSTNPILYSAHPLPNLSSTQPILYSTYLFPFHLYTTYPLLILSFSPSPLHNLSSTQLIFFPFIKITSQLVEMAESEKQKVGSINSAIGILTNVHSSSTSLWTSCKRGVTPYRRSQTFLSRVWAMVEATEEPELFRQILNRSLLVSKAGGSHEDIRPDASLVQVQVLGMWHVHKV